MPGDRTRDGIWRPTTPRVTIGATTGTTPPVALSTYRARCAVRGWERRARQHRRVPARVFRGLALAAVVVLASAASVGTTTGGDTTRSRLDPHAYRDQPPLAYVSRGHVVLLDGTGHPPRVIPQSSGACCVTWAPDGAHLAFKRGADLWISTADGAHTRRIAPSVRQWAWSPDGEAIAAIPNGRSARDGTGVDFYAIDLPRVRLTLLRHYDVLDLAWPGVGRQIAVSARPSTPQAGGTQADLFMLEVPGPYGDCATLCPEPAQSVVIDQRSAANANVYLAGWSPDFARLAIWTGTAGPGPPIGTLDLSLIPPGGGPTAYLARSVVKRSWVQWSSSSDRLLVVEDNAPGSGSVLALCSTSNGCRVVAGATGSVVDPAWSDGGRMAYVTSATTAPTDTSRAALGPDRQSRVWVADSDGQAPTVVASGGATSPRWLPDGQHLLFVRAQTLWLLNTDDGSSVAIAGSIEASPSTPGGAKPNGRLSDLQDGDQPFAVAP